jgi:hypothetical protein
MKCDQRLLLRTGITISLLLLCSSATVSSQDSSAQTSREFPSTSGNAFLRICPVVDKDRMTHEDVVNAVECVSYIEGFVSGVQQEVAFAHVVGKIKPPTLFCHTEVAENGQLVRVVLKYIRNHPEEAHKDTAFLAAEALREAFPCGNEP